MESPSGVSYIDKITLGDSISKDNLLYDGDIDKQNQEWIDKKRRKYLGNVLFVMSVVASRFLLCVLDEDWIRFYKR